MGSVEKFFTNPDQMALDTQKSTTRKEEVLLNNIKYQLIGELRKNGANKITVESIDKKEGEFKVKAKYSLKGSKQSEFTFRPNHMGNYLLKGFDISLDNATPIEVEYHIPEDPMQEKMVFDLSIIQSKKTQDDKCEIIYPPVGVLGTVSPDNMDIVAVKRMCTMASEFFGIKAEFVNDLKINEVKEDELVDAKSQDAMYEAQKEIRNYVKSNMEGKENDKFITLRDNFIRSIELKAGTMVKQLKASHTNGTPKIVSIENVFEYVDGKFDGTLMVKAKIGNEVITYGLPVVKNNIVLKSSIEDYKLKREDFIDSLEKKLNAEIKASVDADMENERKMIEQSQNELQDKMTKEILAYRTSDMQKIIKVDKSWLPEGIEAGQILNLGGNQYKAEPDANGTLYNLVLQN